MASPLKKAFDNIHARQQRSFNALADIMKRYSKGDGDLDRSGAYNQLTFGVETLVQLRAIVLPGLQGDDKLEASVLIVRQSWLDAVANLIVGDVELSRNAVAEAETAMKASSRLTSAARKYREFFEDCKSTLNKKR